MDVRSVKLKKKNTENGITFIKRPKIFSTWSDDVIKRRMTSPPFKVAIWIS